MTWPGLAVRLASLSALAVIATGCQATVDAAPKPALKLACSDPETTSLGVPTARRPAELTTSGGRLSFVVTALPPGSIFGEVEDTEVHLNDPDTPSEPVFRVTALLQQPGVVDVEAGTYSLLNTNRGGIEVRTCPDVTLSDVEPATPDRRGNAGSLVALASSGGVRVRAPRRVEGRTWTASFGTLLCVAEGGEDVSIVRVDHNATVQPVSVTSFVRTAGGRVTPIASKTGGVRGLAGGVRPARGAHVSETCPGTPRVTELLVVVKATTAGAAIKDFRITYDDAGVTRTLTVPWSMEMCGSKVKRRGCR
ncbi:hypothetical protein EXE58_08780 [Nocardioides seonyuensis]|uniref:Uncharacterized protein n=1 Tax=Nocardioides seonyuensis TaxID=2518371 RepID=A0A4P7IEH8_9ACTN|nr:hypothetical protein [Nocardioides seonyuensis]QBX55538.1 hypothetical protein EXE58_08780 [Nocardioides seonyuensis]